MHALPTTGFVRLPQIIGQRGVTPEQAATNKQQGKGLRRPRPTFAGVVPVSASTWWEGVRTGRYPAPVKLGGVTAWRVEDIRALIEGADHAP